MLEVTNLSAFYGKIRALWDVSFEVRDGEIVALVGANGAGKTTLLNAISGIVRGSSGAIRFLGKPIEAEAAPVIVEMGISQVPQEGRLFPDMTVRENLEWAPINPKPGSTGQRRSRRLRHIPHARGEEKPDRTHPERR